MSECIGVTVSHDIAGCVFEHKCGSCVSGTEGPKAFPGAGAQRVEGKVRNGWGIQGRRSWALTFLYIPQPGVSLPLKTQPDLRKYLLGSENSGSMNMSLIFHLIVSACVRVSFY